MKHIRMSRHATIRAVQRGATEEEVMDCVREADRRTMQGDKVIYRKTFPFNDRSPVNGLIYQRKTVELICAEGPEIVVITVKVYYLK